MPNIRETLNRNQGLAIAISLVVIVVALAILFWPSGTGTATAGQNFYTVDDGTTWFPYEGAPAPFPYNGQEAVEALVYQCEGGQPYVAFLRKYDTEENRQRAIKNAEMARTQGVFSRDRTGLMQKKPGEAEWQPVPADEAAFPRVRCEDGKMARRVQPE